MKALLRFASLAAVSLAASLALGTATHADPLKCKQEIAKDAPKFVQAKIKALQKCNDKIVKGDIVGPCPDGDTTIKINDAATKLQTNIAKKCGGDDKTCGNGDDETLASIGWAIGSCPGFESSCTNSIANCNDISTCLLCVGEAAVDQAISLYYDDLKISEFGSGSDANKCQRAIGKNATKFLVAKNKALAKCEKAVLNGDILGPCPDGIATTAIATADSKKRASICKAKCGGDNKLCGDGDDLTVAAIGFSGTCPNVTKPLSTSCAGPIGTVQAIVDCVDCVSEFKADCLDPISVPAVRTYPPECNPCPSSVQADADGPAVDLDTGWTGLSHDAHVPTNGRLTLTVSGCAGGATPPCGQCNLSGPLRNKSALQNTASQFSNHRCVGNIAISCNVDLDCGGSGPCAFYFGAPLPLSAGGTAVCVTNEITGPVTGTVNIESGDTETSIPLRSRVFIGNTDKPCPLCGRQQCVGGGNAGGDCGFASECPGGACSHVLKCASGAQNNMACTIHGSSHFGDVSFDCPPDGGALTGNLLIPIDYTTGTRTRSLDANSPNCRAPGHFTEKCFCDTCDNETQNACKSDSDCTKQCRGGTNNGTNCTDPSECPGGTCTGGICGGKRCGIGANAGVPCVSNSECPPGGGGACGVPGQPTAPNQCDPGTFCVLNPADTDSTNEGVCDIGPADKFCAPHADFAQCIVDGDCAQFNRCVGGTNDGDIGCSTNADCPGGICEIQTCTIQKTRECFVDNGVIGTHCFYGTNAQEPCTTIADCPDQTPGTFCGGGTVTASGTPYPPNTGSGKVAALFCVGPVASGAVNSVSGLPGLGRVTIPTTYTFSY